MTAQYVSFRSGKTEEGRSYNRDILAHDLKRFGYQPIYVGPVTDDDRLEFSASVPEGYRLSDIERYPGGAANVFIKDAAGAVQGIIRVRPK